MKMWRNIVCWNHHHVTQISFFHMHHRIASPFLSSWCKSRRALWNASLTHVANISERKTSESRGLAKRRPSLNQQVHLSTVCPQSEAQRVCLHWSYCTHSFTSWEAIKEVFEMSDGRKKQRSKDSDMIRTVRCLLVEIWLLMLMWVPLTSNFGSIYTAFLQTVWD